MLFHNTRSILLQWYSPQNYHKNKFYKKNIKHVKYDLQVANIYRFESYCSAICDSESF